LFKQADRQTDRPTAGTDAIGVPPLTNSTIADIFFSWQKDLAEKKFAEQESGYLTI